MPNCNICGKPAGFNPKTGLPNTLCKSCYQKNKGLKKPKSDFKTVITKKIDIDSLYRRLKESLEKRTGYQEAQDNLWKYIKRTESNKSQEMEKITLEIGKNTHEINTILGELTQYKKTHKAMNMAYDFLQNEIMRIKRIIDEWQQIVRDVDAGRKALINSSGISHTNTFKAKQYIQKKMDQKQKLEKWLDHVKHYMV